MQKILEFIIIYIILIIIYYLIFGLKYRKYEKNKLPMEITYLKKIYNINIVKDNYKKYHLICIFNNCFIMTFVYAIITNLVKGFVWQLLIGFILLMLLIIISYGLIGRITSKGEDENV